MLRAHRYLITFAEHHDSEGLPRCRKCPCMEGVELDESVLAFLVNTQDVTDSRLGSKDISPPPRRILSHC